MVCGLKGEVIGVGRIKNEVERMAETELLRVSIYNRIFCNVKQSKWNSGG